MQIQHFVSEAFWSIEFWKFLSHNMKDQKLNMSVT